MRDKAKAMKEGAVQETAQDTAQDAMLTRALERRPQVAVPEGFAAKVLATLPARPRVQQRRSAARSAAVAGAAVLLAALWWVAPHVRPGFESAGFDVEMLLVVELAAVAAWLGARGEWV